MSKFFKKLLKRKGQGNNFSKKKQSSYKQERMKSHNRIHTN